MTMNKTRLLKAALEAQGYQLDHVVNKSPCKPVNVIITSRMDSSLRQSLQDGIKAMAFSSIAYHLDIQECECKFFKLYTLFSPLSVSLLFLLPKERKKPIDCDVKRSN